LARSLHYILRVANKNNSTHITTTKDNNNKLLKSGQDDNQ